MPASPVAPERANDHRRRTVHDTHADRGFGAHGELRGVGDRARPQLVDVEIRVPELEQARPQLVFLRDLVLFDKPLSEQGLQETVHGRAREAESPGQFADTQPPRTAREGLEDSGGSIDGLDCRRSPVIRHC